MENLLYTTTGYRVFYNMPGIQPFQNKMQKVMGGHTVTCNICYVYLLGHVVYFAPSDYEVALMVLHREGSTAVRCKLQITSNTKSDTSHRVNPRSPPPPSGGDWTHTHAPPRSVQSAPAPRQHNSLPPPEPHFTVTLQQEVSDPCAKQSRKNTQWRKGYTLVNKI